MMEFWREGPMKTTQGALAVLAGLWLWLAAGPAGAVDACTRRCDGDEVAFDDTCTKIAKAGAALAKCQKLVADTKKKCLEDCEASAKAPPPPTKVPAPGNTPAPAPGTGGAK
jgi:hypothetical protein